VGKASSTKKIQRVARASRGRRSVRRQRSLGFPLAMTAIALVGVLLIVLTRNDREAAARPHPRLGDHFHSAFAIYRCDSFLPNPNDVKEDRLGIHSHGDGLIHIHPFSNSVTGDRATLAVWGDQVGIRFGDDEVRYGNVTLRNGDTCGDKKATLKMAIWPNPGATKPRIVTRGFGAHKLGTGGELITLALVPDGADIPQPPSKSELENPSDLAPSTVPTLPPVPTTGPGGATTGAPTTGAPGTSAPGTATTAAP
jgi:hypothetical protein